MPHPEDLFDAQARATQQFRDWAADPRTLIVDTKTTGLEGEVWEFAAVRLGHPAPVLAFVCAPCGEWSARALEIVGIRLDEVTRAPAPELYAEALGAVVGESNPLSYGGKFDWDATTRTFPVGKLPLFGGILTAYAPLAGRWSEKKQDWNCVGLDEALALEGVDVSTRHAAHTALGDALRAALLVQVVAQKLTPFEEEARENEAARLSNRPPVWDES